MAVIEIQASLKLIQFWSAVTPWTGLGATQGSSGSSMWLLCVCLYCMLALEQPRCLLLLKAFPFLFPISGKYEFDEYSTDCISVTV